MKIYTFYNLNAFFFVLLIGLSSCTKKTVSISQNHEIKSYKSEVKRIQQKADPYLNSGNDTLKSIAERLIAVATQHKDTAVMVDGKLMKAHYELRSSNYPGTMKVALKALSLAEKAHLSKKIPDIYSIIGNAYKENEDYRGALSAAEKALTAARKTNDTSLIIGALLDQAMFTHSYSMLTQNDSIAKKSLHLYLSGLHLAQVNPKYRPQQIPFYDNISQYYKLAGDYEQGIYYGKKGAELARKYHKIRSLTYSYNWLGEMYYYQGMHKKGMAFLDTALQYARDLKWEFRISEILHSKYICYQSSGNFKNALKNYSLSQNIKDSLQMLKNIRQVSLLQIQYQTGKKDQQITMLHKLNKEKSIESLEILIGLILFIGLTVFLALQYRVIKHRNKLLKESYNKINNQSNQLKLLMKELHHRVKNNLQIVSSLLSLQSNHLSDKESKQAVRVGQQRIEAMSLIHRSLYRQENPNMVNMKEYVTGLIESIFQSFGIDKDKFDLDMNIETSEMDVEIALPLGLIINEWVTNSFKHAYKNVRYPALSILLKDNDRIILEIKDNGPGMDFELWENPKETFGIKLVRVLSKQLNSICEMKRSNGTILTLQIPTNKMEKAS